MARRGGRRPLYWRLRGGFSRGPPHGNRDHPHARGSWLFSGLQGGVESLGCGGRVDGCPSFFRENFSRRPRRRRHYDHLPELDVYCARSCAHTNPPALCSCQCDGLPTGIGYFSPIWYCYTWYILPQRAGPTFSGTDEMEYPPLPLPRSIDASAPHGRYLYQNPHLMNAFVCVFLPVDQAVRTSRGQYESHPLTLLCCAVLPS